MAEANPDALTILIYILWIVAAPLIALDIFQQYFPDAPMYVPQHCSECVNPIPVILGVLLFALPFLGIVIHRITTSRQ
jgi:hypothetical protein